MPKIIASRVTLSELLARVPGASRSVGTIANDGGAGTCALRCAVIVLRTESQSIVLDWSVGSGSPPYDVAVAYHDWLGSQSNPGYWDLAFSWQIYRHAALVGDDWSALWPGIVSRPRSSDPALGFLELSRGYMMWDFQMQMTFALSGLSPAESYALRKDWNLRRASASERIAWLELPDGRRVADILETRMLPSSRLALQVPVRAVAALVKFGKH